MTRPGVKPRLVTSAMMSRTPVRAGSYLGEVDREISADLSRFQPHLTRPRSVARATATSVTPGSLARAASMVCTQLLQVIPRIERVTKPSWPPETAEKELGPCPIMRI